MALIRTLLALLLLGALPVSAQVSWLVSGPPQILGVSLSNSYFTGSPTSGTTIGAITVTTTANAFTGTTTLGGADAAKFTISGGNLNAAATLSPGIDYSLTIIPTQAGMGNSGVPFAVHVYGGVTYFLAVGGNDANNGTSSGTPWRTVAHNIHCADTISVAAGTYPPQSFGANTWGAVTCPNNDNVAWVKCATPFACLVIGDYLNKGSVAIDSSYWGVQGFEARDTSAPYGACFALTARIATVTVHHVVFANNVANGCPLAGYDSSPYGGSTGPASVDYSMLVGNLAWNGTASSTFCGSGISLAGIANADNAAGPHIYIALNVISASINGTNCAGGGASGGETDGQGIIIDRPDLGPYTAAITIENNLLVGNGSAGFAEFVNGTGAYPSLITYRYNTSYGNLADPGVSAFTLGDIYLHNLARVAATRNILDVLVSNNSGTYTNWPVVAAAAYPPTLIDANWMFNAGTLPANIQVNWGPSVIKCLDGTTLPVPAQGQTNNAFCSANVVGDPVFTHPTIPGQWFCSGKTDTQACAATVITGYVPTASGASAYGFGALAPTDANNSTAYFRNVLHALPAALNPHAF